MAKTDLVSKPDGTFARQLQIFKENIGSHAANLGLTPAQVTAQAADADYYNYVITCQTTMLGHSKAWTSLRKLLRKGAGMIEAHSAPVLPDPVPPVPAGVERRFRALVRQVKSHANYDPGMGPELGIEAGNYGKPDFATLQPKIALRISGGAVFVDWSWQGHRAFLDQCEIQVDRGDGLGFVTLVSSTKPGYTDKTPFPAVPARWSYRAIYRVGDKEVGQWSNTASVTVPP